MFERFTDGARHVIVLAQDEARTLGHNYIGVEHLLLGLLREENGAASPVLRSFGVTPELARNEIVRVAPTAAPVTHGRMPFTPRAKRVLERALREALSLGDNHIDTEILLLALLSETDGLSAAVLRALGADAETIRSQPSAIPTPRHGSGARRPNEPSNTSTHGLLPPKPRNRYSARSSRPKPAMAPATRSRSCSTSSAGWVSSLSDSLSLPSPRNR